VGEFFDQPEYRCHHEEWPFLFACTGCPQKREIEERDVRPYPASQVSPELRGGRVLWRVHAKRDDPHHSEEKPFYTASPRGVRQPSSLLNLLPESFQGMTRAET